MTIKDDETIDLETPAGPMRTYILRPVAEGRYPGLVMFSEIFQVTGPIRRAAATLAGHGFVVAVPEIFHELEQPARTEAMPIKLPKNCPATTMMRGLCSAICERILSVPANWV
jgi:dienelactone hydrolase